MRALGFSTPDDPDPEPIIEGSSEALTMDGPLPVDASVEPDHLLRLWAQVDRCAQIAAEALAADLMLASNVAVSVPAVKSTLATELWLCVQDAVGLARLGVFEEWSE